MDEKVNKVLLSLQRQCVKREYCTSDVRRKALEKLEGDASAAEQVVSSLKEDRFVDDARYASAFAREKSSLNGWGPIKISYALRAKGVGESEITGALAEVEPEKASDRLSKLLETKWKALCDDPQGKLKLIKFALSRGYEYGAISPLVDKITNGQS